MDKKVKFLFSILIGLLRFTTFSVSGKVYIEDLGEKLLIGFPFTYQRTPIASSAGSHVIILPLIADLVFNILVVYLVLRFPGKKAIQFLDRKAVKLSLITSASILSILFITPYILIQGGFDFYFFKDPLFEYGKKIIGFTISWGIPSWNL